MAEVGERRERDFGPGTTLGFTEAGDNLSATLTVSDGNGGTLITDPPVPDSFMLTGSRWTG